MRGPVAGVHFIDLFSLKCWTLAEAQAGAERPGWIVVTAQLTCPRLLSVLLSGPDTQPNCKPLNS